MRLPHRRKLFIRFNIAAPDRRKGYHPGTLSIGRTRDHRTRYFFGIKIITIRQVSKEALIELAFHRHMARAYGPHWQSGLAHYESCDLCQTWDPSLTS